MGPHTQAICQQVLDYQIVDLVKVPDVPPGDYVFSFRWDCEQTPQIWSQCADVRITSDETMVCCVADSFSCRPGWALSDAILWQHLYNGGESLRPPFSDLSATIRSRFYEMIF